MLAVRVLESVGAILNKEKAKVVIPEKTAADEQPPKGFVPPEQQTPYMRARNTVGRFTSLMQTVSEIAQAISETRTEPHHEVRCAARRR